MKAILLLPKQDNEGNLFPESLIQRLLETIAERFHGCTVEGETTGWSIDNGTLHKDTTLKVSIACENDRLSDVQALAIELGRALKQENMYLDIRDFDGVQIIPIH